MYKDDWNDFIADVSWLIKPTDNVIVSETINNHHFFSPSNEFKSLFPNLTKLLMKARNTRIEINEQAFELLGWTDLNGESFGWLCKCPDNEPAVLFK